MDKKVGEKIGIYELKENKLKKNREAESNKTNTAPEWVFCCMHQAEYLSVLNEKFGYTPPYNGELFLESQKMFCQLDPEEAHDAMIKVVRKRKNNRGKPYTDLIYEAPESLRHTCLSFSKTQALANQIRILLEETIQNLRSSTPYVIITSKWCLMARRFIYAGLFNVLFSYISLYSLQALVLFG